MNKITPAKTFKSFVLLLAIQLGGCAVIHFENGPVVPDPEPSPGLSLTFGLFENEQDTPQTGSTTAIRYQKWYHHAIFQIAELSNPLEIGQTCIGMEWNQVTTEVTPLDALIGLADNALLWPANSAGLDLWSPWSLEYSCRDAR